MPADIHTSVSIELAGWADSASNCPRSVLIGERGPAQRDGPGKRTCFRCPVERKVGVKGGADVLRIADADLSSARLHTIHQRIAELEEAAERHLAAPGFCCQLLNRRATAIEEDCAGSVVCAIREIAEVTRCARQRKLAAGWFDPAAFRRIVALTVALPLACNSGLQKLQDHQIDVAANREVRARLRVERHHAADVHLGVAADEPRGANVWRPGP